MSKWPSTQVVQFILLSSWLQPVRGCVVKGTVAWINRKMCKLGCIFKRITNHRPFSRWLGLQPGQHVGLQCSVKAWSTHSIQFILLSSWLPPARGWVVKGTVAWIGSWNCSLWWFSLVMIVNSYFASYVGFYCWWYYLHVKDSNKLASLHCQYMRSWSTKIYHVLIIFVVE